jgi:type I restriction enzyme M protein
MNQRLHFAPTGVAGFVLADGSMSSNQLGEGEIRNHLACFAQF